MLATAQDDLEHYAWGEESQFPDIWKQIFLKYNLNGNQVMIALGDDLDIYLTYGNSEYDLVWAWADVFYEADKTGKLKASMTAQQYQNLMDQINDVYSRLGIIYANREYATEFSRKYQPQAQSQPEQEPQSQLQLQQAPY